MLCPLSVAVISSCLQTCRNTAAAFPTPGFLRSRLPQRVTLQNAEDCAIAKNLADELAQSPNTTVPTILALGQLLHFACWADSAHSSSW